MSDSYPAGLLLTPSRARCRLLRASGIATVVLALVLLSAGSPAASWAALACLAAGGYTLRCAQVPPARRWIRLRPGAGPAKQVAQWRAAKADASGMADGDRGGQLVRVEAAGRTRIVLRLDRGRAVVWRDATDPQTYRRISALARWSADGGSQ